MHAPVPLPPVTRTACPYCGVGCGVSARPDGIGGAITTGDPEHPANFGRLCSKGFALEETLGFNGRLLHPMLRRADGSHARVDWDTALSTVADGFRRLGCGECHARDGCRRDANCRSGQQRQRSEAVRFIREGPWAQRNVKVGSRFFVHFGIV